MVVVAVEAVGGESGISALSDTKRPLYLFLSFFGSLAPGLLLLMLLLLVVLLTLSLLLVSSGAAHSAHNHSAPGDKLRTVA